MNRWKKWQIREKIKFHFSGEYVEKYFSRAISICLFTIERSAGKFKQPATTYMSDYVPSSYYFFPQQLCVSVWERRDRKRRTAVDGNGDTNSPGRYLSLDRHSTLSRTEQESLRKTRKLETSPFDSLGKLYTGRHSSSRLAILFYVSRITNAYPS